MAEYSDRVVKYTKCANAEQTDDDELENIAAFTSATESNQRDSQENVIGVSETELASLYNGPPHFSGFRTHGGNIDQLNAHIKNIGPQTQKICGQFKLSQHLVEAGSRHLLTYTQNTCPSKNAFAADAGLTQKQIHGGKLVYSCEESSCTSRIHPMESLTPRHVRRQRRKEIAKTFGKRRYDIYDVASTNAEKDGCRWTLVFDPAGRLAYWWSFIVSLIFIYNFWVLIYRSAFDEINSNNMAMWLTLDYLADFVYIMDIAFNFRTGFLDDGVLQTDGTKLRRHYMNSTVFYVDCLCLLPLDFLYLSIGFKSMLRCFRLVKIYRFWAFLDRTERHTNYPNIVRTVTLLHYLFAIYHWNACLMYMITSSLEIEKWTIKSNTSDVFARYLHSLYWSTLTLTTIGGLPMPQTREEYIFVIIEFVFGLLLFATILGHVANIVTSISAARKEFQAKLDSVKTYMMLRRVPLRLQDRVIKWFDYLWLSKKSSDEEKTLGLLPNKLKAEIALHVHLDTLKRVEIFQNTEAGFLCELVLRLRPVLFSPGDFICRKGEVGKEMYIVNRGRLQVVADNGKTVLATLRPGSYFGEISVLNMGNAGNRRTASVRSVGYSDLFCLSKNDLWEVLKDYPTARVRLEAIAIKRLEKYKKAPLEQELNTGLQRSKSSPGLVESSGKIPLEAMFVSSNMFRAPACEHNFLEDMLQTENATQNESTDKSRNSSSGETSSQSPQCSPLCVMNQATSLSKSSSWFHCHHPPVFPEASAHCSQRCYTQASYSYQNIVSPSISKPRLYFSASSLHFPISPTPNVCLSYGQKHMSDACKATQSSFPLCAKQYYNSPSHYNDDKFLTLQSDVVDSSSKTVSPASSDVLLHNADI